jgi:hypothetical protein
MRINFVGREPTVKPPKGATVGSFAPFPLRPLPFLGSELGCELGYEIQ